MNELPVAKRAAIIRALTEGCSIRATARMIGVSKDTVSKLMISWLVGHRTTETANAIMRDVQGRLVNRIQLTTDGFGAYIPAVSAAWHWKTKGIDFAQLVKQYGQSPDFAKPEAHR